MDIEPNISWHRLLHAIEHFGLLNYHYVEVPWLVSDEAICATFPNYNGSPFNGLYVVGSGEQSFIQLQIDDKLPPGKYMTMTPCFRDEPVVNEFTRTQFMKVELYITDIKNESHSNMLEECFEFFKDQIYNSDELKLVETSIGYDINLNGIEIGSYGTREYNGVTWIYGTALAEPRFTKALNRFNG